ncbi:putative MnhB-related membrane protein [Mycetocola sp. CAN_C7]|uniref:tripartite tricarboxylate transporter TctB family protein n=1 Tax=Mycetocola sp. CAN_C7 TaxID=2787724 RepID=UPI0018CA884B
MHARRRAKATPTVVPAAGVAGAPSAADVEPERAAPSSRRLEVITASVTLGASVAGFALAQAIELRTETGGVDPRFWPTVLSILGGALSIALLLIAIVRPPFDRSDLETSNRQGWMRLGASLISAVLFVALWQLTGYLVATPLFLAALLLIFGGRGWKTLVLFPVITTALTYLLFHSLLKVPL